MGCSDGGMSGKRIGSLAALLAAALVLPGCAGDGGPAPAGLPSLDKLPDLPTLTGTEHITGTPTEVYTSIARGALTCWFGAAGPLKGPYIYHAQADPPSKGGRSEIVIRSRDETASDPRSLRAFRVAIFPGAERTQVEVENFTVPAPLADRLKADTARWARGQEGCGEAPMTAGWSATEADKAKAAKKAGTKAKPTP